MWNSSTTNGQNGGHASYQSYGYDDDYAESAAQPHAATVVTGKGRSRHFVEPWSGLWIDRELDTLGDLDDPAFLIDRGLVIAPSGATLGSKYQIRLKARLVVPRDLA